MKLIFACMSLVLLLCCAGCPGSQPKYEQATPPAPPNENANAPNTSTQPTTYQVQEPYQENVTTWKLVPIEVNETYYENETSTRLAYVNRYGIEVQPLEARYAVEGAAQNDEQMPCETKLVVHNPNGFPAYFNVNFTGQLRSLSQPYTWPTQNQIKEVYVSGDGDAEVQSLLFTPNDAASFAPYRCTVLLESVKLEFSEDLGITKKLIEETHPVQKTRVTTTYVNQSETTTVTKYRNVTKTMP